VSPELEGQTMRSLLQQQEAAVLTLLEQQTGNLVVTYPCADQLDDRERFPSQLFLRIFRLTAELPEGDLQDCESWLPAPLGPDTAWCRLTDTENWLNQWPEQPYKDALFKKDFLWLCRGAYALKERASFRFTEHDGLVPEAGHLFGPKSSRVHSANSLQTYGKCPQQFYLQHVLQLSLPEEEALEPGRWLHPLVRGQLLHTVFHRYHLELKQKKRKPDLVQDRALLHRLLQEELQKLEPTLPVVATPTRQLEMQELLETMNLFLGEEVLWAERYQPRYFEVNLGGKPEELPSELDDSAPQEIALPSGRTILLQGRIDRIDLVLGGDGRTYFIWDYKTGKMNEFLQAQAHARGQHLQPLLYLEMVEQRLQQVHGPKARVEGAGYFFPGQKGGQGDRLVWQAADLRKHKSLIDTLIDLQQAGVFLATDRKETCEHCPFRDACDVPEVNRQAVNKLKKPELPVLHALRSLRKAKE
ncbi:MAG TPA: PD-(D/E)XK nuclease family protein, partial [Gemmatales bacterium]|nr:PD-(D/E)XK nuclease family protein [Gemmatales bacterium]